MPVLLDPVIRSISLRCSAEDAFRAWTTQIHLWWPVGRISASEQATSRVMLEGRVGGRIYERTSAGEEIAWGYILVWAPPRRLVHSWFLGTEPDRATEVEVRFTPEPDGTTTVEVNHGKWHEADEVLAEAHHACVAAPDGWSGILADYADNAQHARSSPDRLQDN